MFKMIRTLALSAIVGMGAIAALPAPAEAAGGSVYLSFGSGHGSAVSFRFDDRGRHHYRDHRRRARPHHVRQCSPRDALQKASRMGLRHARIVDTSRRSIKVAGRASGARSHGHRPATITFAKAPHCPVLR